MTVKRWGVVVTHPPHAGGAMAGIRWGLSHVVQPWNHIVRFEVNQRLRDMFLTRQSIG